DSHHRLALLDLIEDRHGKRSMIITSQLPVDKWYEVIGDKTVADAIMDRIIHNAQRIQLKGESLRKKRPLNNEENNKN
ncbi:MAG: ATP-binding protein, partial [Bacteroidetes bacterium]|nr:ATP-binding protein [Bacteroidota bacterium]